MQLTRIFTAALLLLSAQLLSTQVPTTVPAPVELDYQQTPRLLTPRLAIHADDEPDPPGPELTPIQKAIASRERIFDNILSVTLDVVINQNGRVESAHATEGPQRFYAQAEEIAMHRAFAPAHINGETVRARFQDYVSIYPKERWAAKTVTFPPDPDLTTVSISLQRTGCMGSCPSYTVTIAGSGDITFDGGSSVYSYIAVPGTHHARISPAAVRDLLACFRSANFLSALEEYQCNWTDMPSQTLTLTLNDVQKKVIDYGGSYVGLPDAVEALEAAVDTAADTARWVTGNADTLPSLKAEHWNFSNTSAENINLFDSAITRQNADLIHAFLDAKAPIVTADLKTLSPLCAASGQGDRDLLQQMLAAQPKIKLPAEVTDECLSLGARSGSVPVTQLWLSRGARTNFPATSHDEDSDRRYLSPPLISAIQSGNPDVVALLLHAHADVASKSNDHRSLPALALQNARDDNKTTLRILSLLIEAGADVNEETEQDRPAIFQVSSLPEAIPLLLNAGVNIDQRDSEGKTPLMLSYTEESTAALLKAGADPTLKSSDGTTALSEAKQMNCGSCVSLIEAAIKARGPQPSASVPSLP